MNRRDVLRTGAASLFLTRFLAACGPKLPPVALLPDAPMPPILPQLSPDPAARAARIRAMQEVYTYDYRWPLDVAMPTKIAEGDNWTPEFLAHAVPTNVEMIKNGAESDFTDLDDKTRDQLIATMSTEVNLTNLDQHMFYAAKEISHASSKARPDTVAGYQEYFASRKRPPIVDLTHKGAAERDQAFAWQRVAGLNPMVLRRADTLPTHFPVTQAHFTAAVGPGDSLEAARAEGRLYLADYAVLDGVTLGSVDGRAKFLAAPLALFVVTPDTGMLLPVAVQCGQEPGPDTPIFTPADGWHWRMAMMFVQVADGNVHEAVAHLGNCHLAVAAVVLAMRRQLAAEHPVRVLLEPHVHLTLAVNNHGTLPGGLMAKEGIVDQVLACTIETSLALLKAGLDDFSLQDASPLVELKTRGVHDPDALPTYPYRDDVIPLYKVIRGHVKRYLALYYTDDAVVASDHELQAMLAELGSQEGGRLKHLRSVDTVKDLTELVANIVFIASAQHAAVNFPQFDFLCYAPNMSGALWAPAPTADTPDTEAAYLERLPPWDIAVLSADTAYQLSSTRISTLGEYPTAAFLDPRVAPLVSRFQAELAEVEVATKARDKGRLLSYPYLRPGQVPASIHI